MPELSKTYKHGLSQEDAIVRIKRGVEEEKVAKAGILSRTDEHWTSDSHCDFSMTIFGYRVDGDLTVENEIAIVNLKLPTVALMVKGMIETQLNNELEKLFS